MPATCGTRGVVVVPGPSSGIQNGAPDGLALVNASGTLVEFLSYEGAFAATNGPANGITSTNIGVYQEGSEPIGLSLSRNAAGAWSSPSNNTFGACNDEGDTPPPGEIASVIVTPESFTIYVGANITLTAAAFDENGVPIAGAQVTWTSANPAIADVSATGVVTGTGVGATDIYAMAVNGVSFAAMAQVEEAPPPVESDFHVNEIHYDNLGTDTGEAIEIEGPAGADVTGFRVVLYNGNGGIPYNDAAPAERRLAGDLRRARRVRRSTIRRMASRTVRPTALRW